MITRTARAGYDCAHAPCDKHSDSDNNTIAKAYRGPAFPFNLRSTGIRCAPRESATMELLVLPVAPKMIVAQRSEIASQSQSRIDYKLAHCGSLLDFQSGCFGLNFVSGFNPLRCSFSDTRPFSR
jgi:hypothetical protein